MSYIFTDSGEGDLRARRTRKHLKEAVLEALACDRTDRITVRELAEAAEINRKTFYLHYSGIEAMTLDIAEDIARTLDERFTGDLEGDILILYEFLSTTDTALQKLLRDTEYFPFQRHLYREVFKKGAFGEYAKQKEFPEYVSGYFESLIGIYYSYMKKHEKDPDLKTLAGTAAHIVQYGIRGGVD